MASAVLECRGVSAGYRTDDAPSVVLKGVDFGVAAGESVAIVGASGSGKSTLLRLLNRFDDPLDGVVRLHARPIDQYDPLEVRRRVALVPQTPVMFDGTVRDNLHMQPGSTPPPSEEVMCDLLTEVGLDEEVLDKNADQLSVGEKQRVAIARSLVGRPEVLLLDEPTSALDPQNSALIARMLADLRDAREITVLVVTHQRELVQQMRGRRFLIRDGGVTVDAEDDDVERFLDAH